MHVDYASANATVYLSRSLFVTRVQICTLRCLSLQFSRGQAELCVRIRSSLFLDRLSSRWASLDGHYCDV